MECKDIETLQAWMDIQFKNQTGQMDTKFKHLEAVIDSFIRANQEAHSHFTEQHKEHYNENKSLRESLSKVADRLKEQSDEKVYALGKETHARIDGHEVRLSRLESDISRIQEATTRQDKDIEGKIRDIGDKAKDSRSLVFSIIAVVGMVVSTIISILNFRG
jgi:chromosome segregation ATPase